jgi:hypothetical protein
VLLEIFDSFRKGVDPYDQKWKKEHLWLNLAQVCGKWRDVVFASTTRLDIGITVGPEKPGHIKTILSSPLPIFLDYSYIRGHDWEGDIDTGITGSALWRMRAVLKHHPDRVREITFEAEWASFNKFFKMTDCAFPKLESLSLTFLSFEPTIPATFLRADLHHLRRLTVKSFSLTSIFDFLCSATALTDLTLLINIPYGPTPETSLLACLQAMPCLLSLDLTLMAHPSIDSDTPSESSTPEDTDTLAFAYPEEVVIHSKLKHFHITCDPRLVKPFARWFRTPSLEHCKFQKLDPIIRVLP